MSANRCFTEEETLKFNKYEAEYASFLRAKFFSGKDFNGGDIYDLAVTVDNEPIKASRHSPTRTYADPEPSLVDSTGVLASREQKPPAPATGTSPNIPNGSVAPPKRSS